MLVQKNEAKYRKGEGTEFFNYLTSESGTSISVAQVKLDGNHPESISELTDRCYIFVEGEAEVTVEDEKYEVSAEDVIYVEKGKRHSLSGSAKYFVINNPPYRRK